MSDLKERIGRKISYNKTWIRPGYQAKHSPTKQLQTRQIPTPAGYESGQSSHEEDSRSSDGHSSHLGFCTSSRSGGASLLERMGLNPGVESGDDDADSEDVAKSLMERVGPVRVPDNVDRCGKDQDSGNTLVTRLLTEALGVQPLACDSSNPDAAVAGVTKVSANGHPDGNGYASSPQDHRFQGHAPDGEHLKDKSVFEPSKKGHAANSTPPRSSPDPLHLDQPINANFATSYANDVDMLNARSSRDASSLPSSSMEDGEVRDLETPVQVRELLVPLVLQNATGRMSAVQHARPQSMPLDMDTLTDKVCSSFREKVKDLRKGLDSSSVENRSNTPLFEAHDGSVNPGSAHDSPQQMGNMQKEAAPRPIASTFQTATRREESSRPNAPLTHERSIPRYTPSPQRHHWSRSVENSQSDTLRGDRRSPSPSYYIGRHRSPSGEPTYNRHSSSVHEYHSPEPRSLRKGQFFVSPPRHTNRYRSPSHDRMHRLPLKAHEYHSPEPPSPRPRSPRRRRSSPSASRSHFFPEKNYCRSPDGSRSRSPYESARRGRGGYRGRGRRDYPTRRSASPHQRRPYEPYSSDRRRSRVPRRSSQSPDSQTSDQLPASRYSPDRQLRTKKIRDNDFSSQSLSISEQFRNTREDPLKPTGTAKPLFNAEQNALEETITVERKHILPCHHVPGLWFVKVALNDIGTLECSFDIDSETANKWKLSRINDKPKANITDDSPKTPLLSLQIRCLAVELVEETFRSLKNNATPEEIASAIFSLEMEWPTQGHLIIAVNPQHGEHDTKQIFLPKQLGPTSPICIDNLVHEGKNVVQFIQLSNMSGKVFALCATKKQDIKPNDKLYVSQDDVIIGSNQGVVRISPLE